MRCLYLHNKKEEWSSIRIWHRSRPEQHVESKMKREVTDAKLEYCWLLPLPPPPDDPPQQLQSAPIRLYFRLTLSLLVDRYCYAESTSCSSVRSNLLISCCKNGKICLKGHRLSPTVNGKYNLSAIQMGSLGWRARKRLKVQRVQILKLRLLVLEIVSRYDWQWANGKCALLDRSIALMLVVSTTVMFLAEASATSNPKCRPCIARQYSGESSTNVCCDLCRSSSFLRSDLIASGSSFHI